MNAGMLNKRGRNGNKWALWVTVVIVLGLGLNVGCEYDVRLAVQESFNILAVGLVDAIFLAIAPDPPADATRTTYQLIEGLLNHPLC